ncbi:LPO_1073/Vpar_1526 family protein [Micromonospora maris]|uniref:LPO_1073/Vpar_1526 family protein n=1 Tax=Micromonospora maris TaxID=1003110 RepID=UPI0011D2215C|nr:LPO_1073/Vpar_1526 family protein [Micromonospora maris]
MSYPDVREIALDVFRQNFVTLAGDAFKVAQQRAERITEEFLEALRRAHPQHLSIAADPAFQRSLFKAQEEYACSGDEEIAKVLVGLLVDRAKESARSLRQLALAEALVTVPKITSRHISTLSLIFLLRHLKVSGFTSFEAAIFELREKIQSVLEALEDSASDEEDLRYLQYAGCIQMGRSTMLSVAFWDEVPCLISQGVTRDCILDEWMPAFVPHPHHPDRFAVPITDIADLPSHLNRVGIDGAHQEAIASLATSNTLSENDLFDFLSEGSKTSRRLFNLFDGELMSAASLTAVGLAIGHVKLAMIDASLPGLEEWLRS